MGDVSSGMVKQNGIIRAISRVLDRVLSKITVWAITSTDDASLVVRAPVPIFCIRSIMYSVQSIVNGLLLRKGSEV